MKDKLPVLGTASFSYCLAIATLIITLVMGRASAAVQVEHWQFQRPLEMPPVAPPEQLVSVTLDSHVYAHTTGNYADLRVLDPAGTEVPFLMEKAAEIVRHADLQYRTVAIKSLETLPDNQISILIDVPPEIKTPAAIRFQTPLQNYEKKVTIFGRPNTSTEWELLLDAQPIFDYSQFADVRRASLELPTAAPPRQLRIVIGEVTDVQESAMLKLRREMTPGHADLTEETVNLLRRPFRIDRLEIATRTEYRQVRQYLKQDYPAPAAFQMVQDGKDTRITLSMQNEPLTEFIFTIAERNFRRPVTLQLPSPGPGQPSRIVAEHVLYQLQYQDFSQRDLTISFPERRMTQCEVVVRNGDSPPLTVTGIDARGQVYRLVFLARPASGTWQLLYGEPQQSRPPAYDITGIRTLLERDFNPLPAQLQAPVANPAFRASRLHLPGSRTWLLIAVLLVTPVLAWALYTAARKAGQAEQQQ